MSEEIAISDVVTPAGRAPKRALGEYLSVGQAAVLLSVSEKTIRALLQKGQLRGCRVGRLIRIKRSELMVCIETSSNERVDASAEVIADAILARGSRGS